MKMYMQTVKNEIENLSNEKNQQNNRHNLTPGEKKALAALRDRDDIIITKANKGGAVVIQEVDVKCCSPGSGRKTKPYHPN